MKRTCHTLVFSLLLLVHLCRECHKTFALIKQVGSYFLRQQSGLNIHSPAFEQRDRDVVFSKKELKTEGLGLDPTQEEKTLASLLKAAGDEKRGKNGKWQDMFAKYSGSNPIVVNAAMQAALKQRDYDEGLNIYYNRVRYMTLPTFSIAMKLLGKCGHLDEVERLWEEPVGLNLVNQVLAAARIDAAADDGDMGGAESVLNYMVEKDIEANVVHFTSTIRACANAKEAGRAKQAQKMFEQMVAKEIEPNIVTYTNLLRAFRDEPSECCLGLLRDMKDKDVKVNNVFAENFLFIFLKGFGKGSWRKQRAIVADIRTLDLADLQTAKCFVDELRDANVCLNKSCKNIEAAIRMVLRNQ